MLSKECVAGRQREESLRAAYEGSMVLVSKLKDHLQELKGNIRVFCRIRPTLSLRNGGVVDVNGAQ